MPPTEPPPRPVRPLLRIAIAIMKPLPSVPSKFFSESSTSAKFTVVVDDARMPSLSSFGPELTPGQPRSTMNADSFPASPSVRANTVKKFAMPPLVIQSFSPLSIQPPPGFLTALAFMDAASEPEPASVRQKRSDHFTACEFRQVFFFLRIGNRITGRPSCRLSYVHQSLARPNCHSDYIAAAHANTPRWTSQCHRIPQEL